MLGTCAGGARLDDDDAVNGSGGGAALGGGGTAVGMERAAVVAATFALVGRGLWPTDLNGAGMDTAGGAVRVTEGWTVDWMRMAGEIGDSVRLNASSKS